MERLLEESVGDDWRLFRARLVAQERAEKDTLKQHITSRLVSTNLGANSAFDSI
jgi:hypothetical protein